MGNGKKSGTKDGGEATSKRKAQSEGNPDNGSTEQNHQTSSGARRKNILSWIGFVFLVATVGLKFVLLGRLSIPVLNLRHDFFPPNYVDETTWGSYRPGIYFGMRSKVSGGPSFGIAWSSKKGDNMRHNCDGGMTQFGWIEHDGKGYGKQRIIDDQLNATFTTAFVSNKHGWRVSLEGMLKRQISMFLYFADVEVSAGSETEATLPSTARLRLRDTTSAQVRFVGSVEQHGWDAPTVLKKLTTQEKKKRSIELPNTVADGANWFAWHIVLKPGDFEIELEFGEAPTFEKRSEQFRAKFLTVFPGLKKEDQGVFEAGFANMIGGIGYFDGSFLIKTKDGGVVDRSGEHQLLSGTPSRSFFPRGFLWDEGFHGLLFVRWDHWLFMDIVAHWLRLQDENGWIPREVALGEEAESRVPAEFLPQRLDTVNPPALLLAINDLLHLKPVNKHPEVLEFVKLIIPFLGRWFDFVYESKQSKTANCFRWTRNAEHCLGSGLDDYPRGLFVDEAECHLDLQVWMIFFASSMHNMCHETSADEGCDKSWRKIAHSFIDTMTSVLKTKNDGLQDYIGKQPYNKDGSPLVAPPWRNDGRCGREFSGQCPVGSCCSPSGWCGTSPDFCECPGCGVRQKPLDERTEKKWKNRRPFHSPHFGYVSLFPVMFGLLKGKDLDTLVARMEKELISPAGIMSLSKNDVLFGAGENYWRGKVWGNLNYLTLQALHPRLHHVSESFVQAVIRGYQEEKYFMENYDPHTSKGTGARPFTGWTATAALLLASNQTVSSNIPHLLRERGEGKTEL